MYFAVWVLFPLTNIVVYISLRTNTMEGVMPLSSSSSDFLFWESSSSTTAAAAATLTAQALVPVIDDLLWLVPRPREPRFLGWEDDFMRKWKTEQYDPHQRLHCTVGEPTPYDHPVLCHVPAYLPARLPLSPDRQIIPRVIFISWMTRKLGRYFYANILTVIQHHPEYEIIFFTDEDVDRSMCENFPEIAPYFFGLKAGAARIDVWRMLMMERYGGVYLDMDMAALAHLPIGPHDTVVTGVGCWTHVFPKRGGLFEHWSLAFAPHHPLMQATIEIIVENFRNPTNEHVVGTNASLVESSWVIRFTGPATYQRALHRLLDQADCQRVGTTYCPAIRDPKNMCNYTKFHAIFGQVSTTRVDLNHTISLKLLDNANERHFFEQKTYSHPKMEHFEPPGNKTHADFCTKEILAQRTAEFEQKWKAKAKPKT